jgi:hypothetical protein
VVEAATTATKEVTTGAATATKTATLIAIGRRSEELSERIVWSEVGPSVRRREVRVVATTEEVDAVKDVASTR